jgi:hypothetical protein
VIVNIQKILLGGVVACRHMSKRGVSAAEILVIGKAELIAQVSTLA